MEGVKIVTKYLPSNLKNWLSKKITVSRHNHGQNRVYPEAPWKFSPQLNTLLDLVQPYSMSDPLRLATLYRMAREISEKGIEGDVVECGVCMGGGSAIMAAGVTDIGRRVWLYDTFEGIPAPSQHDGAHAQNFTGHFVGSINSVREILQKVRFPGERVMVRKGKFQDTFEEKLPDKVALLHVDADWYDSVLLCLRTFYPLVADGGFIVLDDFGHWEGTRKAFYAFSQMYGVEPLLERVGYTQAFWRKGVEHNRDIMKRFHSGIYYPDAS